MALLDRIEEQFRGLDPRKAALGVIGLPLYAVGWTLGLLVRGVWWLAGWLWAAALVGFRDGRGLKR